MHKVTTVKAIEALLGTPSPAVMLKTTTTFDDGCRVVLAHAPLAGFGFRDDEGVPRATFVGGAPGFVDVESDTRVSFEIRAAAPLRGSGASMVFLLPGVGETLRLNGSIAHVTDTRVAIDLEESWVHCARCVLRSKLWTTCHDTEAPLTTRSFLSLSPFAVVSSWDGSGRGDTSPKGDPPGFIRVLDGHTVAIPDRRGNKRADTFRNLMTCDQISIAALIPGRDEVLHLSGTAYVTDDAALLSTMAVKDKPPHAAVVAHIQHTNIERNDAVARSRIWERSADRSDAPDLMEVAAHHLARNEERGAMASMTRVLSKGLAKSPKLLLRHAIDAGYRRALKDEGY